MSTYISAELRRLVNERAKHCCEYCLTPNSHSLTAHQVDHVIAQKHGGVTEDQNLALSCSLCNKFKGSDLTSIDPETGLVTSLFNPRREQWKDHFELRIGVIVPITPRGRVTARLLQFNAPERVSERELLVQAGIIEV